MSDRRYAALVCAVLLFSYAYVLPRWADWNQNSRLDLTLAIVEQGTIRIDAYRDNTGDYAVYSGHVYTDKAPGASLLSVPPYWLFRALADSAAGRVALQRVAGSRAFADTLREGGTGLLEHKVQFAAALYATALAVVAVPSALLGLLLYVFLGRLVPMPALRAAVVLAYGLATVAFPYSSVLYGHQTAAALLFAAFVVLLRVRRREIGAHWLLGAGALLGLAVLTDYPVLVSAALLGGYAFWFLDRKAAILALVLGGLPFAFVLGWYNDAAFGSPFASGYRYLGRFPEISATGVLGFGRPSAAAVWGLTFGPYRGLFVLSPFLLLAVPGAWYLRRARAWRPEAVLWAALILAHLALLSTWYDWFGGFAIGPRNLLTVLPFFVPFVAVCLQRWNERPAWRACAWGLVAVSFALTWVAALSGQDFPPTAVANPLADFWWPKFRAGDIARNLGMAVGLRGWWSLAPLAAVAGGALAIVWRGARETR